MTDFSRRQVMASAAGVAALGLSGNLAFLPAAVAADVKEKGYYSYKVGSDVEVISIYDGIWKKEHNENFIIGGTVTEAKATLAKAGQPTGFVPIEFTFTVIKSGGKVTLIDAGTGAQLAPSANLGAKGLAAAGIGASDVDTILISHLHPDHIFGLMAKGTNAQVFPNAEIKVGESEFRFWTDPAIISKLPERRKGLATRIQATFPVWKNVSCFNGDEEVAPGIRSVDTPGHTPGHIAFHVSSGADELLILGDLVIVPALFLRNLDWQLAFDFDKTQATATRKAIVERAVSDNLTVAGYHFGFPNSGKIEKDGHGFVFNPSSG